MVCAFLSPSEEEPMTLQVALEATDGFLIASDRKASRGMRGIESPKAVRTHIRGASSDICKILMSPNQRFVCAFSGDDLSQVWADKLLESCPETFASDAEVRAFLKQTIQALIPQSNYPENQQVIAGVVAHGVSPLWRVNYYANEVIVQSTSKISGGDLSNPAAYLVERFYEPLTVSDLLPLAAHFIVEGRSFSTLIGGLDILLVENGKPARFLGPDEIEKLENRSEEIHAAIIRLLAS
jgi:hypothetical protein